MEGPGGNQPRRRAGDSNSPQNPSPIKDWQRNTWYGPAPQDTNPFEEPDEAPELLELRSDNVRQKSGEFWQEQNQQTGYISSATSRQARVNKQKAKKKNSGKLSHMLGKALLFSLVLVLIALGVLYFGVYRVRDIQVVGNELISANDIISISGIKKGDSMLTLDETKIAESMMTGVRVLEKQHNNQTYYRLQFSYIERKMPETVVITVKEREPCCWMDLRGISYVMDKKRFVLWVTEDEKERQQIREEKSLVKVEGLRVKSGNLDGQTVELQSSVQQRLFDNLFLEMKTLQAGDGTSCIRLIQEVQIGSSAAAASSYTVQLTTWPDAEGNVYVVNLGNCVSTPDDERAQIHAKLRSFLLVWDKLHNLSEYERTAIENRIRHSVNGGSIDVTTPDSPHYSPNEAK